MPRLGNMLGGSLKSSSHLKWSEEQSQHLIEAAGGHESLVKPQRYALCFLKVCKLWSGLQQGIDGLQGAWMHARRIVSD